MIHPTAIISPEAKISDHVSIGAFTIVYPNVVIGANSDIGSHCEIGYPTKLSDGSPLIIGANSLIRSHSIFYEGSTFGDGLTTGHRVTVREKTIAGVNFQIGTLADIQGTCLIGDNVRTQSNVFMGQKTQIGNFVWVFPHVVFTNDPHPPSDICIGSEIGDYAAIATMSVILPGVKVGEHSLVAAHSCVKQDVEPHTVVAGSPAKFICATNKIKLKDGSERSAYPWPTHFGRGYPKEVLIEWEKQFGPNSAQSGRPV